MPHFLVGRLRRSRVAWARRRPFGAGAGRAYRYTANGSDLADNDRFDNLMRLVDVAALSRACVNPRYHDHYRAVNLSYNEYPGGYNFPEFGVDSF